MHHVILPQIPERYGAGDGMHLKFYSNCIRYYGMEDASRLKEVRFQLCCGSNPSPGSIRPGYNWLVVISGKNNFFGSCVCSMVFLLVICLLFLWVGFLLGFVH